LKALAAFTADVVQPAMGAPYNEGALPQVSYWILACIEVVVDDLPRFVGDHDLIIVSLIILVISNLRPHTRACLHSLPRPLIPNIQTCLDLVAYANDE